jgi:copper oxidase (laccase) domain-containing protein
MAEKANKEKQTILSPDLTQSEKVSLTQVTLVPGWKTVIKIANEACLRATQDTIKLDPESEDYERVCVERQRRARNITEFSDLFFHSIQTHADSVRRVEATEEEDVASRVGEMFGIHPAKPGAPADAIKNIFGIHPARPKKVAVK